MSQFRWSTVQSGLNPWYCTLQEIYSVNDEDQHFLHLTSVIQLVNDVRSGSGPLLVMRTSCLSRDRSTEDRKL